jgi:hypothetical protein
MAGGRADLLYWRRGEVGPRGPAGAAGARGIDGRDGDPGPPSDTTATVIQRVAGEALGGYRAVKLVDNFAYYADNTIEGDVDRVIGITLNAADEGSLVNIRCFGIYEDLNMNLDSEMLWLGELGQLSAEPGNGLFVQRLGIVISPTAVKVSISPSIIRSL